MSFFERYFLIGSRMRNRKEGRKKRTGERQKRESEKGGGHKTAKETKGDTEKQTKLPFIRGENRFFSY